MDKVLWIIIAAAVAIAMAGILMFIAVGGDSSISEMVGEADDTRDSQTCSFIESEVEAGRMSCDDPEAQSCNLDDC